MCSDIICRARWSYGGKQRHERVSPMTRRPRVPSPATWSSTNFTGRGARLRAEGVKGMVDSPQGSREGTLKRCLRLCLYSLSGAAVPGTPPPTR